MDSSNWRPTQGESQATPPTMDGGSGGGGDWRSQLQPDSRQRIVNKIMETLKRHLPFSGQEGVQELKQIAIRFEEKIYSAATSQSDYLRKISLKMLTMESKSQSTLSSALPSNSAGRNPQDPVSSQNMQSQVHNQNQIVPPQMVPNQSQTRQQLLGQNTQSNIVSGGMQTAASLSTNGLVQNPMRNVAPNSNMQNMSGISQNSIGNSMNQGVTSGVFSNAQRQLQGRQLQPQTQHQQAQNSQQFMYQQNFNIQQPTQQQQSMMQTSSVMQPSLISGIQQNQQSSIQQPPILQQHQQPLSGSQPNTGNMQQSQLIGQQPNSGNMQQNQLLGQQSNAGNMQQSQLIGQQANAGNMQQNQLIGQQPNTGNMLQSQLIGQQPNSGNMQQSQLIGQQPNAVNVQQSQQPNAGNMQQGQRIGQQSNISDMQQQQQQRLLGQQNNIQNLAPQQPAIHQNMQQQQQQQQQQQHFMGQQNNIRNMHQQQLNHPSHVGGQQLPSMQTNQQQSIHMMQQSKVPGQPQTQNALPGGNGHSQQQLMSQLQSQPTHLQQQLGIQHQSNSLQHAVQQRVQNMNPLIQQQNMIDQQKLFQSQRAIPDAPSTSLDSTAQTSSVNGSDWQEEVYQKIKSMKDLYYADLNEMYQKISIKLQQHDSLPPQPKIDQIEKLRQFKLALERLMQLLLTTKNNITPNHREKLPSCEKQIVGLLNPNKPRKPVPSVPHGQIMPPQPHSMGQPHSQIPLAQSHDGGVNPQLQSMNIPGSVSTMQQSSLANLQSGSVPTLSAITSSQQNIPSSLQPSSNLDSGQPSAPSSMQQGAVSSLHQNNGSAPQQTNITSFQPKSGVNLLQQNVNNLHTSSNMLQNQHMKQQQEQQMMQNPQLNQQMQRKYLDQLQKQQLASQMQAHQIPQLHPLNDVNEKMRHLRSGAFPQHLSSAHRFLNQHLKPVPSPLLSNAVSPQTNQHSSPQTDPQNVPPLVPKGETCLHSANSPFAPSPSTLMVPSPFPGDNEKPSVSSHTNVANVGHQQTSGAPQSLSIGTPGISPSPLFEPDGTLGNASAIVSGKSSVTEQPIDRLLRAVKSVSRDALTSAVNDMRSVVSMVDRFAGSAPGNGSRATVGEDLVAMTNCWLQAKNFQTQDGASGTKRMRRYTSAMPLHVGASVGSMEDGLKQTSRPYTPEQGSTATFRGKKVRVKVNHALLEEIREINNRLIDTVVDICDEEMGPSMAAEGSEGTIVKCSYRAITLSPCLRLQYTSGQLSQIQPLKLLIPSNYPECSPILLDKFPVDVSNGNEDFSVKARSKLSISLRTLSQPMSLKDMVKTWDACTRAVICEYAQQFGGGTFSSKYGTWENCLSTA